jgi:Rrf2 family protein
MRLRLTKRTDYAVRACLLLAVSPDVPVSNRRIAQRMVVPDRFLPQVLSDLARAGIIESTSGKLGGYRLSRDPTDLTLLELIETMEGPSRRDLRARGAPVLRDSACASSVWSAAQSAFLQVLAGTTLAEIAARQWTVPVDGPDGRTSPERNLA